MRKITSLTLGMFLLLGIVSIASTSNNYQFQNQSMENSIIGSADSVTWNGVYGFWTDNGSYLRIKNPIMTGLNVTDPSGPISLPFPEFAIDSPFNLTYTFQVGTFGSGIDNVTLLTSGVKFKLWFECAVPYVISWYNFSPIIIEQTLTPSQNETTINFMNLIIPSIAFPREMWEYLEEDSWWSYWENRTGSIGSAEFYFQFTAIENPLNEWGYGAMESGYPFDEMNYYYEWYYTPPPPYYSPPNTILWFIIGMGAGVGIGALTLHLIKRRKQKR